MMRNLDQNPPAPTEICSLDELRGEIDAVDAQILELLQKRMSPAQRIGRVKLQGRQQIIDSAREKAVMARLQERNRGPLSDQALARIFNEIMAAARDLQQTAKLERCK